MRISVVALALSAILIRGASAQVPGSASPSTTAIGTFRGTSTCLVRPSPCHDEVVVYRITRGPSADSVALDALKIVSGQEEDMGLLSCHVTSDAPQAADLACRIPHGVWTFHVRGDSLVGELRQLDNTRFRDVRATRSH